MTTTDIELRSMKHLVRVIQETYDVDFSNYARASFNRRIVRVLEKYRIPNADELANRIKSDRDFFNEFLREVTVNTTEMFRDPPFWRKLRDEVLTSFSPGKTLRIWHAGCSSGEEVFSLAILLQEAGLLDNARIYATDINDNIIEQARSGRYWSRKMEVNQRNWERLRGDSDFGQYYTLEKDYAVFRPDLIRNVVFRTHNLVSDASFMKFDIILCRNVMIYFDQELQARVLGLFANSTFPGAYLCIGAQESIQWLEHSNAKQFKIWANKECIYRKNAF